MVHHSQSSSVHVVKHSWQLWTREQDPKGSANSTKWGARSGSKSPLATNYTLDKTGHANFTPHSLLLQGPWPGWPGRSLSCGTMAAAALWESCTAGDLLSVLNIVNDCRGLHHRHSCWHTHCCKQCSLLLQLLGKLRSEMLHELMRALRQSITGANRCAGLCTPLGKHRRDACKPGRLCEGRFCCVQGLKGFW
jgi:hypothetical protein